MTQKTCKHCQRSFTYTNSTKLCPHCWTPLQAPPVTKVSGSGTVQTANNPKMVKVHQSTGVANTGPSSKPAKVRSRPGTGWRRYAGPSVLVSGIVLALSGIVIFLLWKNQGNHLLSDNPIAMDNYTAENADLSQSSIELSDVEASADIEHSAGVPDGNGLTDSGMEAGQGMTLDAAQANPDVYIKEGNLFYRLESQNVLKLFYDTASDPEVLLIDSAVNIPQIRNDAQLVLIGITNIFIDRLIENGYTIPYAVEFGDPDAMVSSELSENDQIGLLGFSAQELYDSLFVDDVESLILKDFSAQELYDSTVWFDTVNDGPPNDAVSRTIFMRPDGFVAHTQGILTAGSNEELTFGHYVGTEYETVPLKADQRFFIHAPKFPETGGHQIQEGYEIVKTMEGYFEINFTESFSGYSCIFAYDSPMRIVEFVSP